MAQAEYLYVIYDESYCPRRLFAIYKSETKARLFSYKDHDFSIERWKRDLFDNYFLYDGSVT